MTKLRRIRNNVQEIKLKQASSRPRAPADDFAGKAASATNSKKITDCLFDQILKIQIEYSELTARPCRNMPSTHESASDFKCRGFFWLDSMREPPARPGFWTLTDGMPELLLNLLGCSLHLARLPLQISRFFCHLPASSKIAPITTTRHRIRPASLPSSSPYGPLSSKTASSVYSSAGLIVARQSRLNGRSESRRAHTNHSPSSMVPFFQKVQSAVASLLSSSDERDLEWGARNVTATSWNTRSEDLPLEATLHNTHLHPDNEDMNTHDGTSNSFSRVSHGSYHLSAEALRAQNATARAEALQDQARISPERLDRDCLTDPPPPYEAWTALPQLDKTGARAWLHLRVGLDQQSQYEPRLDRLPGRVMKRILKELRSSPASLASLRITCQNMRQVVAIPAFLDKWRLIDWSTPRCYWSEAFRRILMRDQFFNTVLKRDLQLCVACRYPHPANEFSHEELLCPVGVRICRGGSRKFQMCSHMNLSLREVKSEMHDSLVRTGEARIVCTRKHGRAVNYPTEPPSYWKRGRANEQHTSCGNPQMSCKAAADPDQPPFITFTSALLIIEGEEISWSEAGLVQWLRAGRYRLCPHVRICDERVIASFEQLQKDELQHGEHGHCLTAMHLDTEDDCCHKFVGRGDVENCHTTFLVRTGYVDASRLVLGTWVEVRRDPGFLHDACDPAWLAQTVERIIYS